MIYQVQFEKGDEFEERLSLYIYLLDLCNNINHAQIVFDSWVDWKENKKTA